ncbi:hypothetical protein ACWGST_02180 [Agromyces sp. NPDC055520]
MLELDELPSRRTRLLSTIATERFRWWMVFVVLVGIAAVRAANSQERDQFWSARAGIENLEGLPLIRPDTWSWSKDGDWVPNSPLWNVVLGVGWQAGGFWGLFWVAFLSITTFFALALVLARLVGARAFPTLIGFAPVLMFGFSAFTPRATVVVQSLMFVAVLFVWWWGGKVGKASMLRSLLVVGGVGFALSLLGNWLHLSFMLMSAVIAVMWAIGWWASPGIRLAQRLWLTAAGTVGLLLGCVASPYGIPLTLERARIVADVCRGVISEWQSIFDLIRIQGLRYVPFAVVVVLLAILALLWSVRLVRRGGRFDARVRIIVPLAAFGVPAVFVGFDSLRFALTGMLILMPVLAGVASGLIDRLHYRQATAVGFLSRPRVTEYTSGRFWTVIVVGLMVMATPLTVATIPEASTIPEAAVINQLPRGCRLWGNDTVGGPTILLRPDVKVWIDGRADFYGREHLYEYLHVLSLESPLPDETTCVVLSPDERNQRLADALDGNEEWTRLASAGGHNLWVRE